MLIHPKELVEEYYEILKDKYPHLSLQDFQEYCYTPFRFLSRQMKEESLPIIKLKYFGTFYVPESRVKNIINSVEKRGDSKGEYMDKLRNYLKRREDARKN